MKGIIYNIFIASTIILLTAFAMLPLSRNGDTNDKQVDWINEPLFEMIQVGRGGTLTFKEQEKMLPLLAEMGIKTIYLTPIWKYKPGTPLSRYYILDYYELDPAKGTEEDFKQFIEKAHSLGMKVILDLVTAHTGPGRYIYENHKDWILRDKYGNLVYCWPHKQWGYAVDRANPEVIKYFTKIAKYYVDEFNIDGWRVDAIGTQYCNESIPDCPQPVEGEHHSKYLLKSIKSAIGEDKVLYLEGCYLGRLYLYNAGVEEENGCPCPNPIPCSMALPELNEYGDASYSYEFGKCLMQDIIAGRLTAEDFVEFFKEECLYYGKPRGRFLMTHDFGYQFYERNPQFHKVGAVLITTTPGFPHIYHREIFPDGNINPMNLEMFNLYKKLLSIREKYKAIKEGTIENVWKDGDNVIAYLRKYENEKVVVIANFQGRNVTSTLKIPFKAGEILYDILNKESFLISDPSNFEITMHLYGARILVAEDKEPPEVYIEKPKEGYLHIFDRALMPIGNTFIIGKITIVANAIDESGISKVEFYIDDKLKATDNEHPYEWLWNEFVVGKHGIKVIAYDNEGNMAEDKIDVIIFNL